MLLKIKRFFIESICNTMERGIDIIAQKDGSKLLIEAKGATTQKIVVEKERHSQKIKLTIIYQEQFSRHYK